MTSGERIRQLRNEKKLTQQQLADMAGINFTYLSKIECDKTSHLLYAGQETIGKLAKALEVNADEIILMAGKIPDSIKERILQRPEAFRKLASLDDKAIDKIIKKLGDDG